MSKIANRIISIPANVKIYYQEGVISAEGPLGKSEKLTICPEVEIVIQEDKISTKSVNSALAGTYNALISNLVKGVVEGYKTVVKVEGVGYKVALKDKKLEFSLGKSHLDYLDIPPGLKVKVKGNEITVESLDKQEGSSFVANHIRPLRRPSIYKKSKGIYYLGEEETIKLKTGKSLK
jgi:large subunit ribosomal protein L6